MTITAQTSKTGPYNGNGTTTVFSYTFEVQDEAHLVVDVLGVDGITVTRPVLNVGYTVTGVGSAGGGTIVMASAPAVGEKLTITRAVPINQEIDLENRRSVAPEVLEDGFDKLTQIAQDHQEQLDRTIKADLFNTADLDQLVLNINSLAQNGFLGVYYGALASDPSTRPNGSAPQAGDLYFNTASNQMLAYSGSAWVNYEADAVAAKVAAELAETNAETAEAAAVVAQLAAEAARTGAETAETNAEAARDAAFVNADVYADIATGRAAVADGEQFMVVSSDGLEIIRYERTSSSTQDEVARYPSADGAAAIAAREVGFIAPPGLSSALSKIIKIELFRSVNGVAITLPTLLCVRECGYDLTAGGRFRFRLASFDGVSTYVSVANEIGNGFYVPGAQSGLTWVGIQADGTSLGVADNTTIGRVLIDFGAGSAFGTYAGTIAYAAGGITPLLQQVGDRFENDVAEVANEALALSKDYRLPFSDNMTNTALRAICRDISVYVNDADRDYSLRLIVQELSAGVSYRLLIDVFDVASGEAMCGFSSGAVSATSLTDFLSSYPTEIGLNDELVATRRRYVGRCAFDWSTITAAGTYGGTTVALGGINRAKVYGYEDTLALRRDPPPLQTVKRVGSGETYTDFTDAVEAFYGFRYGSILVAGIPLSDVLSPAKPGQVRAVEDATYTVSNLYLPHDLNLVGMGAGRTILENSAGGSVPVLQAHASGVIERMTLKQWNSSYYVVHVDLVNNNVGNGIVTPVVNTYRDVDLIVANAASTQIAFGSGVSSGNEIILENVRAWRENSAATSATYFFHNTGPTLSVPSLSPSTEMGVVRMDEVASYDYLACDFQTLEPSALCEAILNNCQFNLIQVSVASGLEHLSDLARDRVQWRVSGNYDGPWLRFDPVGENVLKTTSGQTPSGDAAPLIFGAVDDLGRGEKWIAGNPADGTTYSLGERLGDCSSVNKTLTIGGETHTFTTDLTAETNANIISAINGSITSYPVSIVDIQLEWVPDAAPKRRMNNNTGSTIPKGRFVKFTGAATIALCGAGERPDGWTHREILNGSDGYIIQTKRMSDDYIENATGSTGEWGITTAGTLDYAASVKLGRTIGGIVTVY